MSKFTVSYTAVERISCEITIGAESPEAAVAMVESYDFDNSEAIEGKYVSWTVEDVSADKANED